MPPTKLTSFVPLVIRNRYFFFADVLLLSVGAWLSFIIRLDTEGIQKLIPTVVIYAGTSVVAKPLVFYFFGLYHRYWRYASADDLLLIGAGTFVAIVVVSGLVYLVLPIFVTYEAVPRSIPVIDWLLTMALVGGVRFAARVLPRSPYTGRTRPSELTRVLVMGAGDAGAMIVRELKHNPQLGMEVVGFIDDDLGKHDVRIHGVPVLGDRQRPPACGSTRQGARGDYRHAHGLRQGDPRDRAHLRAGGRADEDHPRHVRTARRHSQRQPVAQRGDRRPAAPRAGADRYRRRSAQ